MPRRAHRWYAEDCGRSAHSGDACLHRVVPDAMKARLESGAGAGDHMVSDLLFGRISSTTTVPIGIRLTERGGMRADGAIDAQIASESRDPGLAGPFDGRLSGQLAPIRRHADANV